MISFKFFQSKLGFCKPFTIKIALLITLLFSNYSYSQTIVSNPNDIDDFVNAANPGDEFVIPTGSYDGIAKTFNAVGTAENPIIIKAESVGGVTLSGKSKFIFKKCAYITLEGFNFDVTNAGTIIKLEGSNNIRITRNVFKQTETSSSKWLYIGGYWDDYNFESLSHNNRIDHNIFEGKTTTGNYVTVDGTSDEDGDVYQVSQYDRIDHNHFKSLQPRATNEKEAVRIGWSAMSMTSAYCTVDYNLFEDCDGDPEIISVKTCDNEVKHNTFIGNYGTLSLRHGNRTRVEGNYFFGGEKANGSTETSILYTGGIRIYGTDHVIINNYFEGLEGTKWDAPITITQGDAIDGQSTSYSKHFIAQRVTIAYNTLVNNTYGIEIGYDNNGKYSKEIDDITIANNLIIGSTNNLVKYVDGNTQGDAITWKNNLMYAEGTATITSDGSTFTNDEVQIVNPSLNYEDGIWRTTANTPLIINGLATSVNEDIEGQSRPNESNPGADHFSTESVRYSPMTNLTVGPYAIEGDDGPSESLYLSNVSEFGFEASTQEFNVTSNLTWSVTEDADWITVTPENGENSDTVEVTVTENPSLETRSAEITVTGGSLIRKLVVKQLGANAPDGSIQVSSISIDAPGSQDGNGPENTTDKDFDTRWSADSQAGAQPITYDLGEEKTVRLVKIAFHNGGSRTTSFDIEVSKDGTTFNNVIEKRNSSGTTDGLENYLFTAEARYVRINGYGNSSSTWTSISEVEIYAGGALSLDENNFSEKIKIYPIPARGTLNIEVEGKNIESVDLYTMDGKRVISEKVDNNKNKKRIDISELPGGLYIVYLTTQDGLKGTKKVIIDNN